ncbi:MAG: winged helix-turn-helix transcriptional regulator [Prevotellaceae bacterium]|nr:winged helix-turn-helix transcriptional regulator [Prevotellaceae bacterium]
MTVNQQKIIEAIRNNPFVTREELATIARISLSKIGENISKLKAKGIIKRIGPDRDGCWKVLE